MRRKLITAVGLLIILAGAFLNGTAQTNDRWNRLSTVGNKTRVIVEQDPGKAVKGRFARVNNEKLVLRVRGGEVDIPRDSITAVYSVRRSSRMKRGLIGALAGAGAGVGIGVAAVTLGGGDPLIAAGGFLIGIPVGAVIGAATAGSRKGELLYSR